MNSVSRLAAFGVCVWGGYFNEGKPHFPTLIIFEIYQGLQDCRTVQFGIHQRAWLCHWSSSGWCLVSFFFPHSSWRGWYREIIFFWSQPLFFFWIYIFFSLSECRLWGERLVTLNLCSDSFLCFSPPVRYGQKKKQYGILWKCSNKLFFIVYTHFKTHLLLVCSDTSERPNFEVCNWIDNNDMIMKMNNNNNNNK